MSRRVLVPLVAGCFLVSVAVAPADVGSERTDPHLSRCGAIGWSTADIGGGGMTSNAIGGCTDNPLGGPCGGQPDDCRDCGGGGWVP